MAEKERFLWHLRRIMKKNPLIYKIYHTLNNFLYWKIRVRINTFIYKNFVKFPSDGLNTSEKRAEKIIVSLTSYPARIDSVPYAILSMLRQTIKPDKIILWLGTGKFPDDKLPEIFDRVKASGVDIEFREDLGPHTKYFYAVQEYPDDIVITVDDDHIYDRNLIERLYKSYKNHPGCVQALTVSRITFDSNGNMNKYVDWEHAYAGNPGSSSHEYIAFGIGGVLYPPHSLPPETFNLEAMKRLSPRNDDIWLKFMEIMNGTKVTVAASSTQLAGSYIYGCSAEFALRNTNDRQGKNQIQLDAILNEYPALADIIRKDSGVIKVAQ